MSLEHSLARSQDASPTEGPAGAQRQFGDVKVAAEILDVSESYLNKLRMTGGGPPYVKFNAKVKYILPKLVPWALAHARRSTSDPGQAA
jgi:hypothetical protein